MLGAQPIIEIVLGPRIFHLLSNKKTLNIFIEETKEIRAHTNYTNILLPL